MILVDVEVGDWSSSAAVGPFRFNLNLGLHIFLESIISYPGA